MADLQPRGLLQSSSAYWIGALSTLLSGVVRGKVMAVTLGTSGIGLVAQLTNLSLVVGAVAALGLGSIGIKVVAERRAAGADMRPVVSMLVVIPALVSALATAGAVFAAGPISAAVLGVHAPRYVIVALTTVPLNVVYSAMQAVMIGYAEMRKVAVVSVVTAVANVPVVIVAVVLFGRAGGVASVLLTSVVPLLVLAIREPWLFQLLSRDVNPGRQVLNQLAAFGSASLVLGLADIGLETALRARLTALHGLSTTGTYQPASLMSSLLFLPLVVGFTTYLLPTLTRLLAADDPDAAAEQVNNAVRLGVLVVVAVSLLVLAARTLVLVVLFSHAFLVSAPAVELQVVGEFGRALAFIISATLIPSGRLRTWLTLATVTLALQGSLGWILADRWGISGLAFAFFVAWWFAAIASAFVNRVVLGLHLSRANTRLIVLGTGLVAASYGLVRAMPGPIGAVVVAAILLAWVVLAPTRAEHSRGLNALRQIRRARGGS